MRTAKASITSRMKGVQTLDLDKLQLKRSKSIHFHLKKGAKSHSKSL